MISQKNNKITRFYHWIFFLIFPFLSVLLALKNYKWKWSKNIIWLFVSFAGFTLVIYNDTIDANFYKDYFLEMTNPTFSFDSLLNNLYSSERGARLDIYHPILSYFVSRFTNNYHIFFACAGLVFGYFFSRNLWYLLERINKPIKLILFLLLIAFAFTNPFWRIQSVRFWTTTQIFFFGALPFIFENKKKYFWVCLITPLFHWAYIIGIGILLAYKFIGNKVKLYYVFFIISILLSSVNLDKVKTIAENVLPSFLTGKIESYTDSTYQQEILEKSQEISLLNTIYRYSMDFFIILFISILFFSSLKRLKSNKQLFNFFNFTVLLLAMGYFFTNITVLARFLDLAKMFFFAMLILTFQDPIIYSKCYKTLKLCIPILILICIAPLRVGFNYIGVMTLGGNPFFFLFERIDTTINNLLGL